MFNEANQLIEFLENQKSRDISSKLVDRLIDNIHDLTQSGDFAKDSLDGELKALSSFIAAAQLALFELGTKPLKEPWSMGADMQAICTKNNIATKNNESSS